MRISVKHSLDDVLLQKEGLMLEMIARCSSCGSVDNMLKEEALVLVHNAIIDGLFDNLVSFGKEAFELFMQCYGQDIVTIHKTSDELTQLFKTGLVFGVRRDDNKIDCFMTDDVKAEFDRIKADNGMNRIYLAKMNSNAGFKPVKIGRNDPCPCGSGKKYKKCCGR